MDDAREHAAARKREREREDRKVAGSARRTVVSVPFSRPATSRSGIQSSLTRPRVEGAQRERFVDSLVKYRFSRRADAAKQEEAGYEQCLKRI